MLPKEIIRKIRRIQITTNRLVNESLAGEYHSVFKGRGMEFDEVREYQHGDDIRTIDWNVTSRAGHPYVKRYVEERELTVMLLIDASASGLFGSSGKVKGEIAAEISALLAFSAIKNNDRVGLIVFTDEVEQYIPPKKGKTHVLRVIRELLYFKPKGRKTSIPAALEFLNKVTSRRAVAFLISDFIDAGIAKSLSIANRRHDLIAVTVGDPRERELPAIGFMEFEDAETGEIILVDTYDRTARDLFSKNSAGARGELEHMFRSLKMDYVPIGTDRPYIEPLMEFFQQRARRY